jgi:hypothetical protein
MSHKTGDCRIPGEILRKMSKMIIREGSDADNEGLVDLVSLSPMKGNISIRIDRNPDFFRLLELRGTSFVIVAEWKNKLIGSYSASAVKVFINGEPETVYYLADFRVHPDFRKSTVAARLARAMLQKLEFLDADLLFCTAAYGNADVMPFFKGRAFLPPAGEVGIFRVLQIIPTPIKTRGAKFHLTEGSPASSLVSFFNNFMKTYQPGPAYSESSFENTTLITASCNDQLVAALALFDAGIVKQNVLIGLPFVLKWIVALISAINFIYPFVRLPKINQEVRILYIKSFACKPGHEDALKALLGRARNLAYEKKYTFLAIGIHEKDPFLKIFSGYPKFIFKSMGFVASLKDKDFKINDILRGIPFEDFSLV